MHVDSKSLPNCVSGLYSPYENNTIVKNVVYSDPKLKEYNVKRVQDISSFIKSISY